ncbi:MAG: hypothetical protein ACLSW1_06245 [Lachnospira sp.]
MSSYEKPVLVELDETVEGVYAASGCYTVTARIHQQANNIYRIQVDAKHDTTHSCSKQTLFLSFNMPVEYQGSSGTLRGSSAGTQIAIDYSYWNNPKDNIGLGDVTVSAEDGLVITGAWMTDEPN